MNEAKTEIMHWRVLHGSKHWSLEIPYRVTVKTGGEYSAENYENFLQSDPSHDFIFVCERTSDELTLTKESKTVQSTTYIATDMDAKKERVRITIIKSEHSFNSSAGFDSGVQAQPMDWRNSSWAEASEDELWTVDFRWNSSLQGDENNIF